MKKIRIFSTKKDSYLEDFKKESEKLGLKILVYSYENFSFVKNKLTYLGKKDFPEFNKDDAVLFRRCAYENKKQHFWLRLLATLARDAGAKVINEDFMVNFPLHSGKLFQAAHFSANQIPHVSTYRLSRKLKEASFPMIIKKRYSAFGKDSFLVNSNEEFLEVKSKLKNKDEYIIQKFKSLKRDVRVLVLNGQILDSVLRTVTVHEDKHVGVKVAERVKLSPKEKEIVEKVLDTYKLEIVGLDLFTSEDGETWLGEMNFFPNFTGFMKETGINIFELIFQMMAED